MTEASYPPHSPPQPSSTHPLPALFSSPQLRYFPSRARTQPPRRTADARVRPSRRAVPLPGMALSARGPSQAWLSGRLPLAHRPSRTRPSWARPSRCAAPPEHSPHGVHALPSMVDLEPLLSPTSRSAAPSATTSGQLQLRVQPPSSGRGEPFANDKHPQHKPGMHVPSLPFCANLRTNPNLSYLVMCIQNRSDLIPCVCCRMWIEFC